MAVMNILHDSLHAGQHMSSQPWSHMFKMRVRARWGRRLQQRVTLLRISRCGAGSCSLANIYTARVIIMTHSPALWLERQDVLSGSRGKVGWLYAQSILSCCNSDCLAGGLVPGPADICQQHLWSGGIPDGRITRAVSSRALQHSARPRRRSPGPEALKGLHITASPHAAEPGEGCHRQACRRGCRAGHPRPASDAHCDPATGAGKMACALPVKHCCKADGRRHIDLASYQNGARFCLAIMGFIALQSKSLHYSPSVSCLGSHAFQSKLVRPALVMLSVSSSNRRSTI